MKNHTRRLLSRFGTGKKLALQLTGVLVVSSTIGTAAYAATKDSVTIEVDGKKQIIYTHADTVNELLQDENIKLINHDYISVAKSEEIQDEMKLVIEKAKPFTLVIDGQTQEVWSTAKTVQELLENQNIQLQEHDKITPALDAAIDKDAAISIHTAFPIVLTVGGVTSETWSTSITVADFLNEQQVVLNGLDRVEPALDQVMNANTNVTVTRVEKVTDVVEEDIAFAVVKQKDDSLAEGTEKVVQEGEVGKLQKTFEVIKENGTEVSRSLQKEETLQASKDRIVAVGTKKETPVAAETPSRGTDTVASEFYVEATAYGVDCAGCQGVSAGGYNYKANPNMKLIAVDPRVIPLGTKVWVEGYGYAIAGDTGGAIKGHKIDVLMPTEAQASSWGRKRVKIRVLQ